MAHVERARRSWHGDVNYHVTLRQKLIAEAVAFASHDERHIFRQFRIVNTSRIVGCLNGNNRLSFGNHLAQVHRITEIPADVVAA